MAPHQTTRRRTRWMRILVAISTLLIMTATGAIARSVVQSHSTTHAPLQSARQSQDIVVAGGIDGRVYAVNAWTGSVLWMFDSGGPMVDSSDCGASSHPDHRTTDDHLHTTSTVDARGDTVSAAEEEENDSTVAGSALQRQWKTRGGAVAKTNAAAATASLSQMIHSYDGRLYHIDGTSVRELEMNMIDIINANGPVRLRSPAVSGSGDADLLLFGEKETKIFSLDTANGVIQPFLASSSSSAPTILFGRAEFKTRAVHAVNMSAARCFTISEYFLQFAEQSKCSMGQDANSKPMVSPEIIVLPKDADAVNPDDEESTIAAFDPWSNKQLWELQIPRFDVIAVFGVSSSRGASFFKWSIDGPSSMATERRNALAISQDPSAQGKASKIASDKQPRQIASSEPGNESKHLVKTVARDWSAMESQFRLRLLGGNYFLEQNEADDEPTMSSSTDSSFYGADDGRVKRKHRVFWESMESNGKKGVFITYYHVGAMTLGVMVGCVLIAWGFYVKGLSASGIINSIDHQFLPTGHVHQLTIERPGHETITISSTISRSLLMDAAASFGFGPKSLPMIENGEDTFTGSGSTNTSSQVQFGPETETMLLERINKLLALEAAVSLSGPRLSKANLMQLESDPDSSTASTTRTSSTLTLLSDSSVSNRRHSMLEADPSSSRDYDRTMTEDADGRTVPVIEELENSSSDSLCDTKDCEAGIEELSEDGIDESQTSAQSDSTSVESSSESTSSSDEVSSESQDISEEESQAFEDDTTMNGLESAADVSHPRKTSNASAASSANEQEVLFPFVCQSRFANEFVELSALGKGGFGQVMLAENRLDGRKYAIKRVGLHLKHQTSKTLQKFLREVKILALLDHPNIVRYYQAWLEKVEEGTVTSMGLASSSECDSNGTGTAPPRDYSMSNLLAPISEMEYSNQLRSAASLYSNGSLGGDINDGFEWERDSADGGDDVWREEDLTPSVTLRHHPKRQQIIEPNRPAKGPRKPAVDDSSAYSSERCDHWLYIQMQYCAGRTLADYLALPTRSMEQPKLFKIFTQIASAIAHVHSCGLIHRDLKPANIFVADTEGDSIKLGDFGLSRYAANVNLAQSTVEEISTSSVFMSGGGGGHQAQYSVSKWSMSISHMSESQDITAGVGTYLYASPEQVAGKKYNAATDMYSLGMILFELCHERFTTTMERYVTLRDARERKYPPGFVWRKKSPEIMEMLDRLLHQDPMQRPDATEVVQWSQELFELSLAQHHATNPKLSMRSPIHQQRSFHGTIPSLSLDNTGGSSAFSLQVEAGMVGGDEDGGERRPNHNLLKEICDIIAQVSGGRIEIKKCGLHLQDGGVQVLDFILDPHVSPDEKGVEAPDGMAVVHQKQELVAAIHALPGIRSVRVGF